MPALGPTVRNDGRDDGNVETPGVDGIVGQQPAEQGLGQKEQDHDQKIFGSPELTRCEWHIDHLLGKGDPFGCPVPDSIVVDEKDEHPQDNEKGQDPAETPEVNLRRRHITHTPVRRPVVRIAEVLAGPAGERFGDDLLKASGSAAVIGYTTNVGWMNSLIVDMLFLFRFYTHEDPWSHLANIFESVLNDFVPAREMGYTLIQG